MNKPGDNDSPTQRPAAEVTQPAELQEGRDFYWQGSAMVFTAVYHLRRGHCCGNGCRHCPYKEP